MLTLEIGEKGKIYEIKEGPTKEYDPGEYILKFSNVQDFGISPKYWDGQEDVEFEILQWGNIIEREGEENYIKFWNVSKIYEPEPDKIPIIYYRDKLKEIPSYLFSKKVNSKRVGEFYESSIEKIPEDLFKNCTNVISFIGTFYNCANLKEIPEDLFKHNTKATNFYMTFYQCYSIERIPENLFKYNLEATNFKETFAKCTNLKIIPGDLFKNNDKIADFNGTFLKCEKIAIIDDKIIEKAKKVMKKGNNKVKKMFNGVTKAINYNKLPSIMK